MAACAGSPWAKSPSPAATRRLKGEGVMTSRGAKSSGKEREDNPCEQAEGGAGEERRAQPHPAGQSGARKRAQQDTEIEGDVVEGHVGGPVVRWDALEKPVEKRGVHDAPESATESGGDPEERDAASEAGKGGRRRAGPFRRG